MGYYKDLYLHLQEARNPYFSGDRAREWEREKQRALGKCAAECEPGLDVMESKYHTFVCMECGAETTKLYNMGQWVCKECKDE